MQPTSTIWPTHMAPQRKRSISRCAMHIWPIKTYGACLTLTPKRAAHGFSRLDPGPSDKRRYSVGKATDRAAPARSHRRTRTRGLAAGTTHYRRGRHGRRVLYSSPEQRWPPFHFLRRDCNDDDTTDDTTMLLPSIDGELWCVAS
jgi:hypothetical protein